jgi:hypothetical protein
MPGKSVEQVRSKISHIRDPFSRLNRWWISGLFNNLTGMWRITMKIHLSSTSRIYGKKEDRTNVCCQVYATFWKKTSH